ncbi:TRAP transporter large permease subunit [Salinarimonas sp.]|uniref:TRAP transporter large permease n=1 Tax=Salinarimonas sp. TaxID=2766526 RepID=UPI00391A3513
MLGGLDIATWSAIIVAAMVILLVAGVPLAFTTGSIAVALCLILYGPQSLFLVASRSVEFLDSYILVAVPFFILMASLMERSGIAKDLYDALNVWAGRMPGGLGVVTVFVGVILASTVGVIGGEIVLLGLVALPQLLRLGYDRKLAIGTICASGSLGTMIPPSVILVFFGITAGASVGDLFLASLMPGLLLAALYVAYIVARCMLDPKMGPPPPEHELAMPLAQKLLLLRGVALPILIAVVVLGSIYLGFASVTESAAIGVAGVALAIAVRGQLTLSLVRAAAFQTMATCGVVLWLVLGTNALIGVYNLMGGIDFARSLLTGLPLPPLALILVMVGVWILLGFFLDWIGIMLLTMPIFVPAAEALGYDRIWLGILFNIAMQIAYLTPPFAPAAFYLKGVAPPEIGLDEIFSAMWPFIALQIVGLALVIAFPQIALWLPSLAR